MVRVLIKTSDVSAGETARALGLHERTLQRRLREEGTSFERIKDDVRRGMAEALLADLQTPVTEIAELLRYASPAAFTRACRRWFGDSPRNMRRRMAERERAGHRLPAIAPVRLNR
jgi:AraC-like DNA-binding protein